MPKTAILQVIVNLDPVPGTFDSEESAREQVLAILRGSIPHYHPQVMIDDRP